MSTVYRKQLGYILLLVNLSQSNVNLINELCKVLSFNLLLYLLTLVIYCKFSPKPKSVTELKQVLRSGLHIVIAGTVGQRFYSASA